MPCEDCTDEARCDRAGLCQVFGIAAMPSREELLRQCAASGQMDASQVAAHVAAGELAGACAKHPGHEMQERYDFVVAACRDAQDMASRYGWALHAIAQGSGDPIAAARNALLGCDHQQQVVPPTWREQLGSTICDADAAEVLAAHEEPVEFDIERMNRALRGPRIVIPQGLSVEEVVAFINGHADRMTEQDGQQEVPKESVSDAAILAIASRLGWCRVIDENYRQQMRLPVGSRWANTITAEGVLLLARALLASSTTPENAEGGKEGNDGR